MNTNTYLLDDWHSHGEEEYWGIAQTGYGDCDDTAVTERSLLRQAGLPLPMPRLALVLSRSGGRHVVLTIPTDRRDFVLDITEQRILP